MKIFVILLILIINSVFGGYIFGNLNLVENNLKGIAVPAGIPLIVTLPSNEPTFQINTEQMRQIPL
jgi:hypothetical protein